MFSGQSKLRKSTARWQFVGVVEEFTRACNYSFLLLKYRARSKQELASRLKQKRFSHELIKRTLDYLEGQGYLNDEEFAASYITSCLRRGWGRRRIEASLKKLGLGQELFSGLMPAKKVYQEQIRQLVAKKLVYYRGKKNIYQKIVRFLVSRGFDYDDIFAGLAQAGVNRVEDRRFKKKIS